MIGIIGAMQEEVSALLNKAEITKENKLLDTVFYEGVIEGKEVVILQGGIGKVNSAICVSLLLTNYDIDYVINIGSAGGLKQEQNVGDVVVSNAVAYHDVDLSAFARPQGELPDLPRFISADKGLVKKASQILDGMGIQENVGLIVSGDQFISQENQVSKIKNDFPEALCSEMEAASVGHTCYKYNIPFIITRSLSDVFGKDDATKRFVTRYLQTTHCDLFFADGVILVEGSAEHMLLPHFIRNKQYEMMGIVYPKYAEENVLIDYGIIEEEEV